MNEYKIVRVRLGCAFVCVLECEREKEEQEGDIEWLSWGDEDRFWKVEWNERALTAVEQILIETLRGSEIIPQEI